eukprot:1498459-Amphidinium_carterae.1
MLGLQCDNWTATLAFLLGVPARGWKLQSIAALAPVPFYLLLGSVLKLRQLFFRNMEGVFSRRQREEECFVLLGACSNPLLLGSVMDKLALPGAHAGMKLRWSTWFKTLRLSRTHRGNALIEEGASISEWLLF